MTHDLSLISQGCLDIWIDTIVPCLKDTESGVLKDTVVFKIESRSYLKKFKRKEGWHINAFHLGMLHEYQVVIEGEHARKLLEVYSYEWN